MDISVKKVVIILSLLSLMVIVALVMLDMGLTRGYQRGYDTAKAEVIQSYESRKQLSAVTIDGLWKLINVFRKSQKLPELKINENLCDLAKLRSGQIVNDWSHNYLLSNETLVFNSYCPTCSRMGENLAKDYFTAEDTLSGWLNSPAHHAILTGNYSIGCINIAEDSGNYYIALEVGD